MRLLWREAENTYLTEVERFFSEPEALWMTLLVIITTLTFWLVILFVRTLLSEYVKRFWFQRVDRRDIKLVRAELEKTVKTIDQERLELDALRTGVAELVELNDQLLGEDLRHKAEIARLKRLLSERDAALAFRQKPRVAPTKPSNLPG